VDEKKQEAQVIQARCLQFNPGQPHLHRESVRSAIKGGTFDLVWLKPKVFVRYHSPKMWSLTRTKAIFE
jgi:hypothetical protein